MRSSAKGISIIKAWDIQSPTPPCKNLYPFRLRPCLCRFREFIYPFDQYSKFKGFQKQNKKTKQSKSSWHLCCLFRILCYIMCSSPKPSEVGMAQAMGESRCTIVLAAPSGLATLFPAPLPGIQALIGRTFSQWSLQWDRILKKWTC